MFEPGENSMAVFSHELFFKQEYLCFDLLLAYFIASDKIHSFLPLLLTL